MASFGTMKDAIPTTSANAWKHGIGEFMFVPESSLDTSHIPSITADITIVKPVWDARRKTSCLFLSVVGSTTQARK